MLSRLLKIKMESTPGESKQYAHLRLFSLLITGLVMLGVFSTVLFIYQNIYLTIDRTREQIIIDPIFTQEAIDFARLENVQKAWDIKTRGERPTITINPFLSMPISTSSTKL